MHNAKKCHKHCIGYGLLWFNPYLKLKPNDQITKYDNTKSNLVQIKIWTCVQFVPYEGAYIRYSSLFSTHAYLFFSFL